MPPRTMRPSTDQRESRLLLGELLLARAKEIGAAAATDLCARCAEAREAFSPLPVAKWSEQLEGRVQELAAAVAYGAPGCFADQIGWARAAFNVRGVCCSHLSESLAALSRVLARELTAEDYSLVEEVLASAARELTSTGCEPASRLSEKPELAAASAEFLVAVLEGDRRRASAGIRAIQDGGVDPRVIYGEVLAPSLCELGRLWHLGEISVAEEHFATTTAQMVMSEVLSRATPAPHDGRVVLAASVEGDSHDMGVRILADLLELSGWRAIFLGSSVPADELAGGARDFGADLVAISATLPVHLRAVEAAIASVHALPRPVLVGGPAFCHCPETWRVMGADAYAACAVEAVRIADSLVPRAGGG